MTEDTEHSVGSLLSPPITSGLTPASSPSCREVMARDVAKTHTLEGGRDRMASAATLHGQAWLTSPLCLILAALLKALSGHGGAGLPCT